MFSVLSVSHSTKASRVQLTQLSEEERSRGRAKEILEDFFLKCKICNWFIIKCC